MKSQVYQINQQSIPQLNDEIFCEFNEIDITTIMQTVTETLRKECISIEVIICQLL